MAYMLEVVSLVMNMINVQRTYIDNTYVRTYVLSMYVRTYGCTVVYTYTLPVLCLGTLVPR